MVGNKAQKAVAAALTGVLAFGGAAPAFAGLWTDGKPSWYRVDGSHEENYTLGTYDLDDDGFPSADSVPSATSGSEIVKGENRLDTMFDAVNYNADLYKGTNVVVLASGWSQSDSLVAAGVAGMLHKDKFANENVKNLVTFADYVKLPARGAENETTRVSFIETEILDKKDNKVDHSEVPVILTEGNNLSRQARRAITWLAENRSATKAGDFKVYIVGGSAAVSEAVEDAVAAIKVDQTVDEKTEKKAISVERLEGDNRVETSLVAAQAVDNDGWLDDDLATSQNWVYVAGGWAPADALSVSSAAYAYGEPILLTGSDGKLSDDQVAYLKKNDTKVAVNVIGGPAAPSADQLKEQGFNRAKIDQTTGDTRYETSAAVIDWSVDQGRWFNTIAVASGADAHMADALIGGAFVGANGGVLALVNGVDEVTALKEAYGQAKEAQGVKKGETAEAPEWAYIIGGEAAIDAKFADKLNDRFPVQGYNN